MRPRHAAHTLQALADPHRFFASLGDGAVRDEVQRAPALMGYLLGIADASAKGRWVLTGSPDDLQHQAQRGAIFETWVVAEVLKHRFNRGLNADLYFWRDNHGLAVDLVFEHGNRLQPVACRSGLTYSADWLAPVRRWCQAAGPDAAEPLLVYGGTHSHRRPDHRVLSWQDLGFEVATA